MSHLFDHYSDEELANFVIAEITSMELRGVRMPRGWRYQPISLNYLDALHEMAVGQFNRMFPPVTRPAPMHCQLSYDKQK